MCCAPPQRGTRLKCSYLALIWNMLAISVSQLLVGTLYLFPWGTGAMLAVEAPRSLLTLVLISVIIIDSVARVAKGVYYSWSFISLLNAIICVGNVIAGAVSMSGPNDTKYFGTGVAAFSFGLAIVQVGFFAASCVLACGLSAAAKAEDLQGAEAPINDTKPLLGDAPPSTRA